MQRIVKIRAEDAQSFAEALTKAGYDQFWTPVQNGYTTVTWPALETSGKQIEDDTP